MSDHFYGTGESLLFRFTPDIQIYNWTGDNMYFIKGNNESLSIGAGEWVTVSTVRGSTLGTLETNLISIDFEGSS